MIPVIKEIEIARITASASIVTGKSNWAIAILPMIAKPKPIKPPIKHIIAASEINCPSMVLLVAPIALRIPISRVRSLTDTNIMFIIPIAPTKSASPVIKNPAT